MKIILYGMLSMASVNTCMTSNRSALNELRSPAVPEQVNDTYSTHQEAQLEKGTHSNLIAAGKYLRSEKTATTLTITILTDDLIALSFLLTESTKVITARGEPTKYGIWTLLNPTIAKPGCILTVAYKVDGDSTHVNEVRIGGRKR